MALLLALSFAFSPFTYALDFNSPSSITGQPLLGSSFGTPFNATYDFVIIGGGTAGLVLANRLSSSAPTSPSTSSFSPYSVAVSEAGSFYELANGNQSQIPRYVWNGAGLGFDDVNPAVDWNFTTEAEEGIGGQRIHYPRGRCLGGSSARNHMAYNRVCGSAGGAEDMSLLREKGN